MALLPKKVIKGLKTASNISGSLVKGRADLLYNIDLQWKNLFEVLFYPQKMSGMSILNAVADTAVTSVMVKGIEGITFPSFEYEAINGVKHITGITFPEEVSMTFIEDQTLGVVRNFCQRWINSIMLPKLPDEKVGGLSGFASASLDKAGKAIYKVSDTVNSDGKNFYHVFKDDQRASKKNATIILKRSDGLPPIGGWIKLEGLKIKTMSGFDLAQDSPDPLEITVTMAVDNVKLITPINLF